MMKKIIVTAAALGVMLIATVTGCKKDVTLIIQSNDVVKDTISFKKDLQPIFTGHCALSGCHVSGGHVPDLEVGTAYSSLASANLYDTTAPKKSIIYGRLTGALTPAMPMNAASDPSNINALILAWITQGAKNN